MKFWHHTPPPALQLKRISLALGIKQPDPVQTSTHDPADLLLQARADGLPVFEGRPDDPMLDLLGL